MEKNNKQQSVEESIAEAFDLSVKICAYGSIIAFLVWISITL